MSVKESALTIGPDQACSSLPGGLGAQAVPNSRHWAAFASDSSLQIVRASHVEEYGKGCRAPAGAMVDFQGDDPEAGPMLRYTIVTPQNRLHQKTWPIRRGLAGLVTQRDLIAAPRFSGSATGRGANPAPDR
jgi:hypothetical protein